MAEEARTFQVELKLDKSRIQTAMGINQTYLGACQGCTVPNDALYPDIRHPVEIVGSSDIYYNAGICNSCMHVNTQIMSLQE